VRTGYGAELAAAGEQAHGAVAFVADDLAEAVDWILRNRV
jgi:hypothetical protein